MKRSIINGLLALVVMLPMVGGFTSCKDTEEDQINALKKDQYDLTEKVKTLNEALETLKQLQAACKSDCETKMADLLRQLNELKTNAATKTELNNAIADFTQKYSQLTGNIAALQNAINTANSAIAALQQKDAATDAAISTINQTLNTLNQTVINIQSSISTLTTNLNNLTTQVSGLETTVNTINTNLTTVTNNLSSLTTTVNNLSTQVAPIIAGWSQVKQQAYDAWSWVNTNATVVSTMNTTLTDVTTNIIPSIKTDVQKMQTSLDNVSQDLITAKNNITSIQDILNGKDGEDGLIASVQKNQQAITELQGKVNNLINRLDNLVTGILLQGTVNPVFGTMSLPINVQSNILMTYFGENLYGHAYNFPDDRAGHEFDNVPVITEDDWAMLNQSAAPIKKFFAVEEGVLMNEEEGNAGRVYVTVNPNNVDFSGMTLPIVNSQDVPSGIKLGALRRSDEVLTFGYSRAANNGFYEADATLAPEDVEAVKVDIEPGLKSAMKNALTDRNKKSLVDLMKVVYDQFNGILPANGLKAAWTVDGVEYATYSQYNLAATAFKPLSFKFLQGTSIRNLPTITPISGFDFDMSKFTFNIDMPDFTINTDGMKFDLNLTFTDIKITSDAKISITIEDYPIIENGVVTGSETKIFEANPEDIKKLIDGINTSLQEALQKNADRWNNDIAAAFDKAMNNLASQIQGQIDDMMDKVAGQINDEIKKMLNEINNEINNKVGNYISKANSLINKYNSAADRINNFLNNANNYLQVNMLVQGADGMFHNVSNTKTMPSPFVINGGDALVLYLTTYTGEIVVPCLQKYVGVTNVFDGNGNSAQAGDATCLKELTQANATEFMNSALSGDQRRVAFSGKSGYTYELVYSALDYSGYTSTRKFYVTVK